MLTNPPPTLKLSEFSTPLSSSNHLHQPLDLTHCILFFIIDITSQLIYSPTASLHPIQSFSSYSIFDERVLVPQVSQEILRPTREINLK